jgi:hypothetical protein
MEVDAMRELKTSELSFVSGAGDGCSGGSGNDIGGVTNSGSFGRDLINIYEGAVQATSYVIERVARAWKSA